MLNVTHEDRTILQGVLSTVRRAWAKCGECVNSTGREAYADYTVGVRFSLCGAIIRHSPAPSTTSGFATCSARSLGSPSSP